VGPAGAVNVLDTASPSRPRILYGHCLGLVEGRFGTRFLRQQRLVQQKSTLPERNVFGTFRRTRYLLDSMAGNPTKIYGVFGSVWNARQAVPTPTPSFSEICRHDAPEPRRRATWAASIDARGRPSRMPLACALRSPALTLSWISAAPRYAVVCCTTLRPPPRKSSRQKASCAGLRPGARRMGQDQLPTACALLHAFSAHRPA
jgi:hypothetical protein